MDFSALSQTPSRQLEDDTPYSCPTNARRQFGMRTIMAAKSDIESIKNALALYGGVSLVSDVMDIFGDD